MKLFIDSIKLCELAELAKLAELAELAQLAKSAELAELAELAEFQWRIENIIFILNWSIRNSHWILALLYSRLKLIR